MEAYWIWNYGDFEIYHSNLVNSRRQEFGVDIPAFWNFSDVDRNVRFFADIDVKEDGYIKLYVNGIGHIMVDGNRVNKEERYEIKKGQHTFKICVSNLTGLPSAYLESDVCPSNGEWYTYGANEEKIPVGYDTKYNCLATNPEQFIFSYDRKEPVQKQEIDGGILYDFGKELFGFLYIDGVDANSELHVSYGESMEEAIDVKHSILFENISGKSSYKLRQRAFRYIYILGAKENEKLSVYADFEYLPLEYKGAFRCNNDAVNKIWDMCAYTLHLNMREVLTEAIKRDRWLWGGDSYQAFKFNRYLFDDKETTRRSTIALRGKEPFTQHINTITDYSFYWVIGLYEYYMDYGDIDFIRYIYPKAVTLMDFASKRLNADGFITRVGADWIFIDWSDIDKYGAVCAEQMLYIEANRAMTRLSELLKKDATLYKNIADEMLVKVNEYYWNEDKGAYIDCYESGRNHVSRHANIFAVMYDIATKEQTEKIIKNVFENDEITKITTPYFEGYELDVMGKIGRLDYIENMINSYWKGMLDLGATTVWEEYNPSLSGIEHYAMYENKYGKSLCHAWGASPIYLFGRYYLGVSQLSAGYKTFEVRPVLGGFEYIDGAVPINGGTVYVYASKERVSVMSTKAGGVLIWDGKKYELKPNEKLELILN